jgi:hypothetical protein
MPTLFLQHLPLDLNLLLLVELIVVGLLLLPHLIIQPILCPVGVVSALGMGSTSKHPPDGEAQNPQNTQSNNHLPQSGIGSRRVGLLERDVSPGITTLEALRTVLAVDDVGVFHFISPSL